MSQTKVYVINNNGNPLMPCKPAKAKHLLKTGKAKVIRKIPFTIKLLWDCEENTQEIVHGLDTGSKTIGSSCTILKSSAPTSAVEVVYASEIMLRQDISKKMMQRASYRRNRRNRKTRYRKPRFSNRRNSTKSGRIPPSLQSKIGAHYREIKFVTKLLPVSKLNIELASFDISKISDNPPKEKKLFYNTKAYVLHRDNYKCQHCKGKTKDKKLEVHHIIFRSKGGSDHYSNLITLCHTCHSDLHDGKIDLKLKGHKSKTKHATHISIIKSQIRKNLSLKFEERYGYQTKYCREEKLGLAKEHWTDAVAISLSQNIEKCNIELSCDILYKQCVAKGDYQRTKGRRSEKIMPSAKLFGYRKFDRVKYGGKRFFIKGRMSSGYFILCNIFNEEIKLKPIPKPSKMSRDGVRKSWIIINQKITANIH